MISHFEKVSVLSSKRFPQYVGREGVVLGISQDEYRIYDYAVRIWGEPELMSFLPEELIGKDEFVRADEIYDKNDRIRVRVENGRGFIIDE